MGCRRSPGAAAAPAVRGGKSGKRLVIAYSTEQNGYLTPCGCSSPMLGGNSPARDMAERAGGGRRAGQRRQRRHYGSFGTAGRAEGRDDCRDALRAGLWRGQSGREGLPPRRPLPPVPPGAIQGSSALRKRARAGQLAAVCRIGGGDRQVGGKAVRIAIAGFSRSSTSSRSRR